ncbi:MAG TPA: hypothetical protein VKA76_14745 [Gammaproteobacteria bacterium]|nr:hypothetical protein [Gammaproteobacteria bacterium]
MNAVHQAAFWVRVLALGLLPGTLSRRAPCWPWRATRAGTAHSDLITAMVRVRGARYAVVYAPRRLRTRFPASCLQLVASPWQARRVAALASDFHAVRVVGPTGGCEDTPVFHLVEWLD